MELLYSLQELFQHYDNPNPDFPLPMFDTGSRTYRDITSREQSLIYEYAKAKAQSWAAQIHPNPTLHLESRIEKLRVFYADAVEHQRRAAEQSEDTEMDYRKLAYAYIQGVMLHAAALFKECYEVGNKCADIFFIGDEYIDKALCAWGFREYKESREDLCKDCIKADCHHRCSPQIGMTKETPKDKAQDINEWADLFRLHSGIKVYLDRLVPEYLKADYSLNCSQSIASVIAYSLAVEFGITNQCVVFQKLWGVKDLKDAHKRVRAQGDATKGKIYTLLEQMCKKKPNGINLDVIDREKVDNLYRAYK